MHVCLSSLQRTLTQLREYQEQREQWLHQNAKLLSEQAPPEMRLEQHLEYEEHKIRESLDGKGNDSLHTFAFDCVGVRNGVLAAESNRLRNDMVAYGMRQSLAERHLLQSQARKLDGARLLNAATSTGHRGGRIRS